MIRLGQPTTPHSTVRARGLLVCALLLGLLGMHGLGPMPGAVTVTATATASSGHERMAVVAHTDVMASAPGECDHGGGGCTGHSDHADATCASASVTGTPVIVPVLLPDTVSCAESSQAATSLAGSGPDGGRAPPSLSELQLLRI
ncbi:DUF6153 family protein [Streptomyces sp. NPDC046909]|uniref:DUF6153 family protein n=1 Tax=Streptomyces sp. NPDC046909 TaxID=3155617 RepID=UPI0034069B8C